MKKLYLLAAVAACTAQLHAQYLVSHSLLQSYTESDVTVYLNAQGVPTVFVPISNGIDVYKITYNTVNPDSTPTIATGTLFLPIQSGPCKMPMINYNHGTTLKKSDAPSNMTGEYVIGIALGADGYAIAMPDYLGLGDGPGMHPYMHAHSEATCSIDMMRASRELISQLNFQLSDQVFITGYSQGGHVAMSTHKMIQEQFASEFNITASAPLSGPYDVSGVQADVITKDSAYGSPGYLPFVLFSYNQVYGMYSSYSQIFKSPYDTILPPLFDGSVGLGTIENYIPDTPNAILIPELLDTFETDPTHIFHQVLRDNDLYRWAPEAPVKMVYCESDELVSFHNAVVAYDSLIAYGGSDITRQSASSSQSHSGCALYALLVTKGFFDGLRADRFDITYTLEAASTGGSSDGSVTLIIDGGVAPYTYDWSNGASGITASGLAPGTYTVTVTDANSCSSEKEVTIGVVGLENIQEQELIALHPNPAAEFTTLRFSGSEEMRIHISDVAGRSMIVFTKPAGLYAVSLQVQDYAPGVYFVTAEDGVHSSTQRLVIE